jgi:hypothetical protein
MSIIRLLDVLILFKLTWPWILIPTVILGIIAVLVALWARNATPNPQIGPDGRLRRRI